MAASAVLLNGFVGAFGNFHGGTLCEEVAFFLGFLNAANWYSLGSALQHGES
jgi:hypothetical protein